MRDLAERSYFALCLMLGRLLRSARYSRVQLGGGGSCVRKSRVFYAPLLVWLGGTVNRTLRTGVHVLAQRDWEAREREMYKTLFGASIGTAAPRTILLPRLPGRPLADILDDTAAGDAIRQRAIECAVAALREFHRLGLSHGDAMAENVLVDLAGGAARWFDFETIHEPVRPAAWRRADDLRALLTTCLVRTPAARRAAVLANVLNVYADQEVTRALAADTSVWRRALVFHLAQAPLSFETYRELTRLLRAR